MSATTWSIVLGAVVFAVGAGSCTPSEERQVRAVGLDDTTAAVEAAHGSEPLRRLQHKDSRHVKKALPLFWMY